MTIEDLLVHELSSRNLEHGRVDVSKLLDRESPSMKTRAEANRSLAGVNTHFTHGSSIVIVSGNDDVHVLNNTLEEKLSFNNLYHCKIQNHKSVFFFFFIKETKMAYKPGMSGTIPPAQAAVQGGHGPSCS